MGTGCAELQCESSRHVGALRGSLVWWGPRRTSDMTKVTQGVCGIAWRWMAVSWLLGSYSDVSG